MDDTMFPNADDDGEDEMMRGDAMVTIMDAPGTGVKIQDAFGRMRLCIVDMMGETVLCL